MPKVDEKGRELTGIEPSQIVEGGMQSYGNKTTGVTEEMEDAMFDDSYVEPETQPQAPPQPIQKKTVELPTKKETEIPNKYEIEPEEEEQEEKKVDDTLLNEESTSESEDEPKKSDEKTLSPADSEVEIDQKEYEFLKTLDVDQLIARMVSHRKGKATVQSHLDKLKNVVGESFAKAIEEGQDLRGASRLLTDLAYSEFQDHLAEFYSSHELRNGKYIRTKEAKVPPPDILSRYTELLTKQAELNPVQFMDKDIDFDANEALARPGSPSGRAWSKYESEKMKIQREIDTILQQSASAGEQSPDKTREAAAVLHTQWQDLISKNKELQDQTKLSDFKHFVEDYRNRPLEAFLLAFRQSNNGKANTIRLVMKELDRVNINKSAPATTSQKEQSGISKHKIKVPNNIRREDVAAVIKDHETFGDIL